MISTVLYSRRLMFCGVLLAALTAPANAQMAIPSDVKPTCIIDSTTFATWFESGSVSANGAVKSSRQPDIHHRQFRQQRTGHLQFLPMGRADVPVADVVRRGLSKWVFDSPGFFDVSPSVDTTRRLIPNSRARSATPSPSETARLTASRRKLARSDRLGGSGVLLSQAGSLVYYGIHVNEVYGYFLTGQKGGDLPDATTFPRNAADLKAIQDYVKKAFPDVDLADPDTLTIELKTSWVDAATLSDASQYVQIDANVPAYTRTKDAWTLKGTEQLTLALVGMHVVGTVQDHPEFIWATFEHVSNAPDAAYSYTNTAGKTVNQPFSSEGDFLFMAKGGTVRGANVECMHADSKGNIVPTLSTNSELPPMMNCSEGVVPSNTLRAYPWGSPAAGVAGTQPDSVVQNNTLLLSINSSVIGQLSDGDTRKNYVQVGGIWTTTSVDAPIPNQVLLSQRGSLKLSNATMETYQQGTNCFSCHQLSADATDSFGAFGLSHIYSEITPLTTAAMKKSDAKCTAADGSLQFLKGVTCQGAQTVTAASEPCGGQNYQPFPVGDGLGNWETQDQCGGGQQPYQSENGAKSFMWYSCSRYPGDC